MSDTLPDSRRSYDNLDTEQLRARATTGYDFVSIQRDEALAEVERLREALHEIASDLGTVGDPAWRCAMEALGLDADAAERAWHD